PHQIAENPDDPDPNQNATIAELIASLGSDKTKQTAETKALQKILSDYQYRIDSLEKTMAEPVTLAVQEAFTTIYLKVSFVAGLIFASPWVIYQIWLFVAAGLYPHERKYVYIYLPISIILFLGGALFCFYAVFPFVLSFLLGFNKLLGVNPQIRLSEWISFAITLPVMFGLSFQLPLVMLFLERISVFSVKDYHEKRRMAILIISIISMLMTPADPMSMILMMIPLIVLYELGILMCKFFPNATASPFEAA
ncbi:MAG: twin-arginine translocase subunit TatC, partial [Planctomycetota bacterium]